MTSALFLSPHLDDVAFSCAATLWRLHELGWQTRLITLFTATMPNPQGFALHCQTDKGLAPDVDYMALRRKEDDEFARLLGVDAHEHWRFAEAPHRGYNSGPQLFEGVHDGDEIWRELVPELQRVNAESAPDVIFAPQGIGNHIDHLHLIRAVVEAQLAAKTIWYRDTPYVIREPDAQGSELLPRGLQTCAVAFDEAILERKVAGCCAYITQVGQQFAGDSLALPARSEAETRRKLREFHAQEAARVAATPFAERFLALPGAELPIFHHE